MLSGSSSIINQQKNTTVNARPEMMNMSNNNTPLRNISLKNLLSFGPEGVSLDLAPLNVLIGPNGSGKSNLFDGIELLRSAPVQLTGPIRSGGGIRNWIWGRRSGPTAAVETININPHDSRHLLRHRIEFTEFEQTFRLVDERVENEHPDPGHDDPFFFYRFQEGRPALAVKGEDNRRPLQREDVAADESILSQRKDPDQFPELAYLSNFYGGISLYREWGFGRKTVVRQSQSTDVRPIPLMEDFSNLGMFLNRLRQDPRTKARLIEHLSDAYEGLNDFELNFEGGTVQVFFTEGDLAVPATRLSDGSMKYLCLLAILLNPYPPPLVCIEEPEMGMHPDLVPKIADLLVEASEKCQLILTTHSDMLVDALSDRPESVVVCEKHDGCTTMNRLDSRELTHWLEKYRLGQLWTRGQLGGVRW